MRFVKVFWVLSLLGFLAALLFVYADIGDATTPVKLRFAEAGLADFTMKKIHFFYTAFFTMLTINIVILLVGYAIPYLPKEAVFVPKKSKWFASRVTRKNFYWRMKNWIRGFASITNLFLICSVFSIYYMNSRNYFPLSWTYWLCALLLAGWIVAFFPVFNADPEGAD